MSINDLIDDFSYLDDWEDRYRYVIELGKDLEPLPEAEHSDANKVKGCVSQVWLQTHVARGDNGEPVLTFIGDSDAHIVRGLIAIVLRLYSGRPASEIAKTPADPVFQQIGLDEHLSPQRSNGLHAMVGRIQADASAALADAGVA
ncbi:Sulfur acceptor protein SufE for iron-sulfur cluster assembly [Candidatus Phaeomarinobacter ectocarpi]|uniref:Sulfur acceptor protein SufE for iron-sulfur cluster assembly n=1 Tax=Candidatus Phaeomarinibacter ectocarpi TaxID=1458461 RepID=X5MGL6_9HYPH|nr:Sulfur acceptor protein SufE for iron-sulfur cluster assembly [Candidatus Phaeomarinobacter ectocarpi]